VNVTDRPKRLVLDDGQQFKEATAPVLPGSIIMALIAIAVLTLTKATFKDLLLPFGAIAVIWLAYVGIHVFAGLVNRFRDRRAINRFFRAECWLRWQLQPDEWRAIVDNEYRSMLPEGGVGAYVGAVYSGTFGLAFAAIMILVVVFAIKEESVRRIMLICSGVVFFLFFGAGLIQPIQARLQARKYRRRALRVTEPRVWFGADGIYHEAFGYTSLKELVKVGDHVKRRKAIRFTAEETTSSGSDEPGPTTYRLPTLFHVPSGYEEQASRLVRRYRAERLIDRGDRVGDLAGRFE
jgi:hypothetical protein